MHNLVSFSEESESIVNEFDITNRHDSITAGVQNIRKLYEISTAEARHIVESAYVDYLSKLPKTLEYHKNILKSFKSQKNLPSAVPVTKLTINLLKCLHKYGPGSVKIQSNFSTLHLTYASSFKSFNENLTKTLNFSIYNEEIETACFELDLFRKISEFGTQQIVFSKSLNFFETLKSHEVDFCVCLNVELSSNDKEEIIKLKNKGTVKVIRKLKMDSQGIDIEKEFKPSCCDCLIV